MLEVSTSKDEFVSAYSNKLDVLTDDVDRNGLVLNRWSVSFFGCFSDCVPNGFVAFDVPRTVRGAVDFSSGTRALLAGSSALRVAVSAGGCGGQFSRQLPLLCSGDGFGGRAQSTANEDARAVRRFRERGAGSCQCLAVHPL